MELVLVDSYHNDDVEGLCTHNDYILILLILFAVLYAPSLGPMGLDLTLPLPRVSVYHLVEKTSSDPPHNFHPEDVSYFVSSIRFGMSIIIIVSLLVGCVYTCVHLGGRAVLSICESATSSFEVLNNDQGM